MTTVDISDAPPPDWDRYVDRCSAASAYHKASAVMVGSAAFGLAGRFLTARNESGLITGVLPLVEQKSLVFGHFLTSLPFFNYGGILADDAASASVLVGAAEGLRRELRAHHVELRHVDESRCPGLPARKDKVTMVLALPEDQATLDKKLGAKLRSQVRRADRESLTVHWGHKGLLPDFHAVFCQVMHRLGTPVYPAGFFEAVLDALGEKAEVLVIRRGTEPMAVSILVSHGRMLEVPWAAATDEARSKSVNMRLYREMLGRAVERGFEEFDFGRSTPDSGTYRFKSQWGATPRQLYWHYCLPEGARLPMLNQSNPKYALAARLWSNMPLWVANLLGPYIVRHLP